MSKRFGAIVWHYHMETGDRFLALEKRGGYKAYPSDSYVTFLTGPNFSDLDDQAIERMKEYARANGITLTTDKVTTRKYR